MSDEVYARPVPRRDLGIRLGPLAPTVLLAIGLVALVVVATARCWTEGPAPVGRRQPRRDRAQGRSLGLLAKERATSLVAAALLVFGSYSVLIGGSTLVEAWYASSAWAESGDGELLGLRVRAESPLWIEPDGTLDAPVGGERTFLDRIDAGAGPLGPPDAGPPNAPPIRLAAGSGAPDLQRSAAPSDAPEGPSIVSVVAPPRAAAGEIDLVDVEFRFFDPPEPGAHARLAAVLRNRADVPSDPVALTLPARWFASFDVIGAIPGVLEDRVGEDGSRSFQFPGLEAGATATLELHVTATDEDLEAPEVFVGLLGGAALGQARPRTVAPRPRPGPAGVLAIPALGLRAGVVQTAWEPPPFVVGQIRGTANVSEGNTVLIGHLEGPAGNVFARLNRVALGDEVVAVSRGLEYRFVVSGMLVLSKDDSSPMLATPAPRLTLMTCIGAWNPLTRDYSHRLWVVAEPPELAQVTIAANAERAVRDAQVAATAVAAEAEAATAVQAESAPTATPPPPAPATVIAPSAPATAVPAPTPSIPDPVADATPPGGGRREPTPAPDPSAGAGTGARSGPSLGARSLPEPVGLEISAPGPQARVPRRFMVRGVRAGPDAGRVRVWLFVRPQLEGGRWYPYPREIVVGGDGSWEAEIDLGGPPAVRHELRIGVIDLEARAELARYIAEHPDQPLEELPEGFRAEAAVIVVRR